MTLISRSSIAPKSYFRIEEKAGARRIEQLAGLDDSCLDELFDSRDEAPIRRIIEQRLNLATTAQCL